MPAQQSSNVGPISPPSSGFSPSIWGGGFDFGLAQPKSGLGYGLLGDTRTLGGGQTCDECPPDAPCPTCDGADAEPSDGRDGQIIRTQAAIPAPGWFLPPPLIGTQPQPSSPPMIGDPNAWWNKGDADVADWIRSWTRSPPSEDVEQECEEQLFKDEIYCKIVGATRSKQEAEACYRQAMQRYGECRKNGGIDGITSPPFRRD